MKLRSRLIIFINNGVVKNDKRNFLWIWAVRHDSIVKNGEKGFWKNSEKGLAVTFLGLYVEVKDRH